MHGIEVTLISPVPAKVLADVIWAFDILHEAEFIARNSRFPNPEEKLRLCVSQGSTILEAIGENENAINGLLEWIKETLDPRYRKRLREEVKKLENENALVEIEVEAAQVFSMEKQRLDLTLTKLKVFDYKLDVLDKAVLTAEKISKIDPESGRQFLGNMVHSIMILADATERSIITSYRSGLFE